MAKKTKTNLKQSKTQTKLLLLFAIIFAGIGIYLVSTSFAAKRSTNPYNLAVVLATKDYQGNTIQGDKNGDGKINHGDIVQYTFTWPNNGEVVQAETQCVQNGTYVFTGSLATYGSNGTYIDSFNPGSQDILLGSALWTSLGGGATCTAKLESFPAVVKPGQNKITNLGTFTYYVSP